MKLHAVRIFSMGALLLLPGAAFAQDPYATRTQIVFSAEELDNLVAPVALYPDPLLAQILIAATFPDQITIAAEHVRARGTGDVDNQPWDLSVRAVAHYPPVLNMLYEDQDWAVALGQAYAGQSADVMDAVQRLRIMAQEQGNLVSTPEQTVHVEGQKIVIVPANPQVIYVPTYDPEVVYFRPVMHLGFRTGYWSFGIGFPIGAWLVYDFDWYGHRIYYDGWYGGGWRVRSRPYIHITPVYVHHRYRTIHIGRPFGRYVNFGTLDRRYRRVRHTVTFVRHDRDRRGDDRWYDDRRGRVGRGDRGPDLFDGDRRTGTLNPIRPERSRTGTRSEPARSTTGFGTLDKRVVPTPRATTNGARTSPTVKTPPRTPTVFRAPSVERSKPSASSRATINGAVRATPRVKEPAQSPTVFRAPSVERSKPAASSRSAPGRMQQPRATVSAPVRSAPRTARSQPSRSTASASVRTSVPRAQMSKPAKVSGGASRSAPSRASGGSVRSGGGGKGKGGG
jgi:hypothetical protein